MQHSKIKNNVALTHGITIDNFDTSGVSLSGPFYWVDTSGSDSNPGTASLPFKTIGKAAEVSTPGTTIFVRRGIYHETVRPLAGSAGKPITYIGERGPNGEWLTIIDPSTLIVDPSFPDGPVWSPAPEIGAGVYKASLGYNPGTITYNGQCLARLGNDQVIGSALPGFKTILAYPLEQMVDSGDLKVKVPFWDLTYAVFAYNPSTYETYIRFKDGTNPNMLPLRVARIRNDGAWTFGVDLYGMHDVIIRDFQIQGAQACIRLAIAHDCTMKNLNLMHGVHRIYIQGRTENTNGKDTVYNNLIDNNKMALNFYGYNTTGAYANGTNDGSAGVDLGLKEYFYIFFKYLLGQDNTNDVAIKCGYAGSNNIISNNDIGNGGEGIFVYGSADVKISNNYFHDLSDVAVLCSSREQKDYPNLAIGVTISDNKFFNCARSIRLGSIDVAAPGKVNNHYIYRNTFYNPNRLGTHLQFHYEYSPDPLPPPSAASSLYLYIYHNNFGSCDATSYWGGYPHFRGGIPNARIINNIFSNPVFLRWVGNTGEQLPWINDPTMFRVFSYNWMGDLGEGTLTGDLRPTWVDTTNIVRQGLTIWLITEMPDWVLPLVSDAREHGIDISKAYHINNITYPPLPGFSAGYYSGSAPDMGTNAYINNLNHISFNNTDTLIRETDDRFLQFAGFNGLILPSGQKVVSRDSVPTSNYWNRGDIVLNKSPEPGGSIGWVCTASGTPGTWKAFGLIGL